MTDTHAQQREKAHAKLLTFGERQVLAYLYRDQQDALTLALQLWVAATDEQLRVSVSYPGLPEEVIALTFANLDDEGLAAHLETMGIPAMIAEIEEVGRDG